MATREHRETQNVEQTKKTIPFVTCEFSLCQHVCELVFLVSTYLIWISVHVIQSRQLINLLLSFVSWCFGFGDVLHRFP